MIDRCRRIGWTPRSFQISVYSSSSSSSSLTSSLTSSLFSHPTVNCSWIQVVSLTQSPIQFAYSLSLRILPSLLPSTTCTPWNPLCTCSVKLADQLLLPIQLQHRYSNSNSNSNSILVRWFERMTGDRRKSNGDSAWTNYYRLYQYLSKLYGVDVVQADEEEVGIARPDVCLYFGWERSHPSCPNAIHIITEMNKVKWGALSLTPNYQSCSIQFNGKKLSRVSACGCIDK